MSSQYDNCLLSRVPSQYSRRLKHHYSSGEMPNYFICEAKYNWLFMTSAYVERETRCHLSTTAVLCHVFRVSILADCSITIAQQKCPISLAAKPNITSYS
ncbi:hypothetical protein J6590_091634 [Homalodisca vitripennis]|nr:hypothetical protein J6590_091634 [Homalodisca vitripennis]